MGNSFHSDNPICPVNVIVPDPKFFNSIPKSPNPTPLPFEKRSRLIFRSSLRSSNRKCPGFKFEILVNNLPSSFLCLNRECVEQETDRLEQRRNPREIILGCLSEGRGCRSRIRYPLPAEYAFKELSPADFGLVLPEFSA